MCTVTGRVQRSRELWQGPAASWMWHLAGLGKADRFLLAFLLPGILKLFARIGFINQTAVLQRHGLCLLEPLKV